MPPTADVGPVADDAGRLEPIAPGVWVWLGTDGPNVGVIVEDDGITLIDTTPAPSAARALNEELKRFGVPVRRVVYTSSHVESVGGSAVFWMAARYGRAQTNALLEQPVPVEGYRRLVPGYAHDYEDDFTTRPVSHVVDAAAWLTPLVCAVPVSGSPSAPPPATPPGTSGSWSSPARRRAWRPGPGRRCPWRRAVRRPDSVPPGSTRSRRP